MLKMHKKEKNKKNKVKFPVEVLTQQNSQQDGA